MQFLLPKIPKTRSKSVKLGLQSVDQEVSSDTEDILHRYPIKAHRGSCVWLCSIRIQSIQSLTNFVQQHLMPFFISLLLVLMGFDGIVLYFCDRLLWIWKTQCFSGRNNSFFFPSNKFPNLPNLLCCTKTTIIQKIFSTKYFE